MINNKGYKYRIESNSKQKEQINKTIGCARWVYNHFLEQAKKDEYKSYNEYANQLPGLKKEYEWLTEADSIALQQSLKNLDRAFQNFLKVSKNIHASNLKNTAVFPIEQYRIPFVSKEIKSNCRNWDGLNSESPRKYMAKSKT